MVKRVIMMPVPEELSMRVTLHLVDAIEEQYRTVDHTCTISIAAPGIPTTACSTASDERAVQKNKRKKISIEQCERATAITQKVHYS